MIPLTNGGEALCDVADVEFLRRFRWRATQIHKRTYATTTINGRTTYMHRLLMPEALEVDHQNRDGLDNRRENLRPCTHAQNMANAEFPRGASGYRGVRVMRSRWQARLKVSGKVRYLGVYDTPEEAARAYDVAAFDAFGEFAAQNFPYQE